MQKKAVAPGSMTAHQNPEPSADTPAPSPASLDGRTFRVGARDYAVHVTPGPLLCNGGECSGATTEEPPEILIAPDQSPVSGVRAMLRELARAWTFEVGTPRDETGWIDLAGTVALAALRELLPAAEWAKLEGRAA